jgi:hypothetical protein
MNDFCEMNMREPAVIGEAPLVLAGGKPPRILLHAGARPAPFRYQVNMAHAKSKPDSRLCLRPNSGHGLWVKFLDILKLFPLRSIASGAFHENLCCLPGASVQDFCPLLGIYQQRFMISGVNTRPRY